MSQSVGFVGLGSMGLPMATNLAKAGYQVLAYNRTPKPSLPEGLRAVETPADAAAAGAVVTMLADDVAVKDVCDGPNGLLVGLPKDGLHISMSTISPATTARLAASHGERDQLYLAAPVFGRPELAAAAKLWVVVAGPAEPAARAKTLLEAMSQRQFQLGERPENANVVKLAGNFLIASMLEALGEAYALARKAGVAPTSLLDVIRSPLYEKLRPARRRAAFQPSRLQAAPRPQGPAPAPRNRQQPRNPNAIGQPHPRPDADRRARGMGDLDWAALTQVIADNAAVEGEPLEN